MAYFSDEQMMQILSATNAPNLELIRLDPNNNALGRQSDIDAKYGTGASSKPPIAAPTRQPNYPDQIIMTNEPNPEFSCPVPGMGDCFARVPREDITQVLTFSNDSDTPGETPVELDNVRGMRLCSISGLISFEVDPAAPVQPTETDIKNFMRQVAFYVTVSIRFRGQEVPQLKEIPISRISPGFDCCDDVRLCIDCVIPQQGGMEIVSNMFDADAPYPDWLMNYNLALRMHFSGCGCDCNNKTSCGCS